MTSKIQFQTKADGVGIEVLWKALTKDKYEVIRKVAPNLLRESQILEDDGHGNVGIGSVSYISFGSDAPNLEPFKERTVEFDEVNHLVSFQGIGGGYMKLGFVYNVVSFKLDYIGEGNTMISTTATYDLEKDFDGTEVLEEFTKILSHFVNSIVSYLQKENKA